MPPKTPYGTSRHSTHRGAAASVLLLTSLVAFAASQEAGDPTAQPASVLVLDNCDSNFKTPPFTDTISLLDSKGQVIRQIGGLNICQSVGGNRAISVSEDGRWFVVCENVGHTLTAYDMASGTVLWSLPGEFTAAVIVEDTVYALTSAGTIYGDKILTIDHKGKIAKEGDASGFDIVPDPTGNSFWLVGENIKKCDANLKVILTLGPIAWCAVSADVDPDGSIWVAERRHPDVAGSQNRLLKISPDGVILRTVPLNDVSPMCVRVDRSDGSVWITGIAVRKTIALRDLWRWPPQWRTQYKYVGPRTLRYSAQGALLVRLKHGRNSLEIDPSDGSVWVGDRSGLLHYSRNGKKLGACGAVSTDQKWIAVVLPGDASR